VAIVSVISKINSGILPLASRALQALRHRVTVEWPKIADDEARKLLINFARESHDRIMREQTARAGVFPEWDAYANTPGNTNLQSVKLPGPIVYRYRYLQEIVLEAIRMLKAASPPGSGKYKNAHKLWINGDEVPLNSKLEPGQEIAIANTRDYARRLEVGKKDSGEAFLISVPNHIYERVAKQLAARYQSRGRGVAEIKFGYLTLPKAWVIKGLLGPHYRLPTGKLRKRRQHVGELVRAPAIFIKPLS
jgi:hypothetical protein